MPNWFETSCTRIRSGELTEGQIRLVRRRINRALDTRYYRAPEHITPLQASTLLELIRAHAPAVTAAQAAKGTKWLRSVAWTPKGKRRATMAGDEFTPADLAVLESVTGYRLVDIDIDSGAPVYRCLGSNAHYFDYVAGAWQSGGAFHITRRA
jgi:hypothetical protein